MHLTTTYSRRDVLKLGAAGAIALSLAGTPLALRSMPVPSWVGLILPETPRYPQLGARLLAGLQDSLAQRGSTIRLMSSTTPSELLAAGAQMIVALSSPTRARHLQAEARAAGSELLVIGAGEALPVPDLPYLGLGYWQASWAAGREAVRRFGPHIVPIADAYESGFDSFYAFQLGVEAAGGQTAPPLLVGPGLLSPQEALAAARAERPDALYVAADSRISRAIGTAAGPTPVVVGGFSTLGGALPAYSVTTWPVAASRPVDPFALLGRDLAALLSTGAVPQQLQRSLLWNEPNGDTTLLAPAPEAAICSACAASGVRSHWTNAYLNER